jgi:serine/threonine protein kinase
MDDPEATTSYTLVAGPSTAATRPGGQSARPRHFDFLGPPRAEGELGWLAHYRVRSLVGEGGLGLVFLAEDTQLFRPVALKVIKPEMAGAPRVRSRFVREAQATAAIKHDHIVTIYQVGQDHNILFLAMEYLQGLSLQSWLERGRKPSIDLVLRIGREIAAGLAAAHRHGLIHRDIKPANIWLEAPSGRAKILDFGMARSERHDVQITHSGTVLGTPAYMAPEQARGEAVGAGSDLFSLGCVLYRLCTGRLPFEGETILAVLSALSSETPRPPRQIESDVPPTLDALVMRLLAKDPAARPASAQAVVEAITAIERELLAQRQQVGLAEVKPRPDDVPTMEPLPVNITDRPAGPSPPPRLRGAGRTRWIGAAVIVIVAAAAVGGLVSATHRRNMHGILANQPTPFTTFDRRARRDLAATKPKSPAPSQPGAGADHYSQGGERGVGPGQSSPMSSGESLVIASNVPRRAPGGPETGDDSSHEMKPGDEQPGAERSQPKGPPAEVRKADREREDWSDAVDPDGDCKIDLDRTGNQIRITVPGTPHALSAELGRLNAPRLLRAVKGDLDARVRVAGVFHPGGRSTVKEYTSPYHGAGILLWQDEENYVRLEIAADVQHGKPRPYANFESRKEGALAVSRGLKIEDGSSYLRLKRRGDDIYAAFGPDGVRWTSFPPLSAKLKDRLSVGVSAINTATKPLIAQLDGFEVSERPAASTGGNEGEINP